jgi:type IV secretory pathway TraG/TraD family ATPase VirD4
MASPAVAATVDVPPDEGGFDVELFLRARGTLCLLGADKETGTTAPLLTCLVGRLVERARIIASHQPNGRLDPPLTLFLNEASKIVPLPVDAYFADHRGLGIPTIVMVQSRSHLMNRWGPTRGQSIWDTATVKLLYGGSTDEDYLRAVEMAGGTYTHREIVGERPPGLLGRITAQHHVERRPVIDPANFRTLGKFRYVVLRANMRPQIARTRKTWKRHDVRAARKQQPGWPYLYSTVTPEIAAAVEAAEAERRRFWVAVPGLGRRSARVAWEDR